MKLHQIAEKILYIDGKPPDFESFFMHKDIYDSAFSSELLLKCSRQVGKSVLEASMLILSSVFHKFYNSLHVSPQELQMHQFVKGKLDPMIKHSPGIKALLTSNMIGYKEFVNGSRIYLRYAKVNADRIRGISADSIYYDEVQEILWDVIPIINECLAESKYMRRIYAGTPKSLDNTIEFLWTQSKQYEWHVKCDACGHVNIPYDGETMEKMIGKEGPICTKCGKYLYPPSGRWEPMNPEGRILGFHITRLLMYPKDETKRKKQWKEVLIKYETYPKNQFYNEVLGVSVPVGGQPLTMTEIMQATYNLPMVIARTPEYKVEKVYMGIDWGIMAEKSFTVITIGGFDTDGKFKVLYAKRFYDTNILEYIDEIVRIFTQSNAVRIGADFGAGATNNMLLRQKIGDYNRVFEFMYTAQKELYRFSKGKIMLDRTQALDRVILGIKKKEILLNPS